MRGTWERGRETHFHMFGSVTTGIRCGLLGLAVLTWALPSGTAQEGAVTSSGEGRDLMII